MAKINATRVTQYPLVAEFTFNFDDTMVNTAGNTVDFGKVNPGGAAGIFVVAALPYGAVVIGGDVVTETGFDTAGFDVTVGDATSGTRYLGSTDRAGAGRTALVPTGFVSTGEDIRFAFSSDDVCTAGKMTVRIEYTIRNRGQEVAIA